MPDRLHLNLFEALLSTDKPIGRLLAEGRTEAFREILKVDREPAGPCATYFSVEPTSNLIFRTYGILARRQPIMLITEKFPPISVGLSR